MRVLLKLGLVLFGLVYTSAPSITFAHNVGTATSTVSEGTTPGQLQNYAAEQYERFMGYHRDIYKTHNGLNVVAVKSSQDRYLVLGTCTVNKKPYMATLSVPRSMDSQKVGIIVFENKENEPLVFSKAVMGNYIYIAGVANGGAIAKVKINGRKDNFVSEVPVSKDGYFLSVIKHNTNNDRDNNPLVIKGLNEQGKTVSTHYA
ncbi:hypothetical protein [Alicyclobacillus fastidiosus]|uniref:Uncharacterized protein n=1 Tax=Alicyclobacillus fastidiosus TaxID=392011 RepID=A0ABV5ALY1_9BACL|nr:hypothetical protein [Alicyclobacillus fastidiosus]WEH10983.1 hypothetical protein PYS47_07135 [Alicyclobacillus fastidiosus]